MAVVAELAAVAMRVVLRWSWTWWSPSWSPSTRRSTSPVVAALVAIEHVAVVADLVVAELVAIEHVAVVADLVVAELAPLDLAALDAVVAEHVRPWSARHRRHPLGPRRPREFGEGLQRRGGDRGVASVAA